MTYFQQGDVLLKQTEKVLGKKLKTDLLYKGQQHNHKIKGKFSILKSEDKVFVKSDGCVLFHEEHKDIKIPKGNYELGIVNEYDHWKEESRKVID